MDFYPSIWNVLHDGSVIAVQGSVPGTLKLSISIDYLRMRFPDQGNTIQLTLTECTRFAYLNFDDGEVTTDFSAIAAFKPMVLSAKLRDGLCVVDCVNGSLELMAAGGLLALDNGRAITLQELLDVADAYWTEWSATGQGGQARL